MASKYVLMRLYLLVSLITVAHGDMVVKYCLESDISGSATVENVSIGDWGNGTAVNSVGITSGVAGIIGKAFDMSGLSAINTGNKLSATGDFTLAGCVKIAQTSARSMLFGQYADSQAGRMVFYSSDNSNGSKARVFIEGGLNLVGTTTIDDGQWHYLALTRAGDTFTLYVDGESEASGSVSGISLYQGTNLCVGNLSSAAGGQIVTDGIIDEIAVYNSVLSSEQISKVYALYTEIKEYFNLPYATDHFRQKLDIFRPADNAHAPLIILIHGGGWFRGERAWTYQDAIFLAQTGYAVACIGYRLVPDYPDWSTKNSSEMWQNMKWDLMTALQYLVDNASTYGIDASKAIVMGSSAGGHLSLALKGRAAVWVQQGVVSRAPEIVGVVAHSPVSDLTKFTTPYSEALKINVAPEDIDPIKMGPSQFEGALIVHGDNDTSVPISHSMGFIDVMVGHGIDAKLAILPGAEHSFFYELGLDACLSPYGYWPQPPRIIPVEHGHVGFNATMVCVKSIPGYDLPYTPFDETLQYYYYGEEPVLKAQKPLPPTASWLLDGDMQGQYGEITATATDDGPDSGFASGTGSVPFNYKNNETIDLDGDSDFVNFGNPESLQITDEITVSLWLKRNRDSSNSSIQYILSKWDFQDADGGVADNNNRGWMIFETESVPSTISTEVIAVQISADGTNNNRKMYWNQSDVDAFDGQWHHVAFTFDNGILKFYLDGVRLDGTDLGVMTVGTVSQIYNTPDVVSLGAITDVNSSGSLQGSDRYTGGLFDEVAIWHGVLSDNEILWLYKNSLKAFQAAPGDANADGLVNSEDLSIMVQNWLIQTKGGFTIGDFDSDDKVDMVDVSIIADAWLGELV